MTRTSAITRRERLALAAAVLAGAVRAVISWLLDQYVR